MKIFQKLALVGLVASSISGTALADTAAKPKPAAPAAPAPTTTPAPAPNKDDVAKFLAFFDKLVDVVVADKDDCKKMATDVNGHIDANKAILQTAADAQAKGQKLPDEAQQHMMKSAGKLGPAMQKCAQDKDVQTAFMRMPHGGSSPSQHKQ